MFKMGLYNINYKYEENTENTLENINFEFHDGMRVGIVGDNGCGKTTLLKIITGELIPDSGNIVTKSGNPAYLSQQNDIYHNVSAENLIWSFDNDLLNARNIMNFSVSNDEILKAVEIIEKKNGYEKEIIYKRIINILELEKINLNDKFLNLSGGEKTKVKIASMLMKDPGFLIFDEPTNHLDYESLIWLEDYLSQLAIPYIIVSHDRRFLDRCVNLILELDNKTLSVFSGNYSDYYENKKRDLESRKAEYTQNLKKIEALDKDMREKKRWAEKFQPQTGRNGYAPAYEDVTNSGKKAMKRAVITSRRLERLIEDVKENQPFIKKEKNIVIKNGNYEKRLLASLREVNFSFSEKKLIENISFDINKGDRILIKGRNGTGKTTLLKITAGILKPQTGNVKVSESLNIGYFCQEHSTLQSDKSIIDYISVDYEKQLFARTVLGCLNIKGNKVFSKINNLSPGEKSKVILAEIIVSRPDLLILDEPTNHLELSSIEKIEKALCNFEGGIIFVSHDRYFSEKVMTKEILLI